MAGGPIDLPPTAGVPYQSALIRPFAGMQNKFLDASAGQRQVPTSQEKVRGIARLPAPRFLPPTHVKVIGLDRFSHGNMVCIVRADRLENFRVASVHKPSVLRLLDQPESFPRERADHLLVECLSPLPGGTTVSGKRPGSGAGSR